MSLNEVFSGCRSQTAYLFCGTEHKKQVNFTELAGCKKRGKIAKLFLERAMSPALGCSFAKKQNRAKKCVFENRKNGTEFATAKTTVILRI